MKLPFPIVAVGDAMFGVEIKRNPTIQLHRFTDYFVGFDKVEAVREIFGENTGKVLNNLKVEFYSSHWGYMAVTDEDGHLMVSAHYLKTGDERDLYLDVIHELVHVRQFMEGQELFDDRFEYVNRPTEVEAYKHAVKEAKRIGLTEEEILDYLRTSWIEDEQLAALAEAVGVKASPTKKG